MDELITVIQQEAQISLPIEPSTPLVSSGLIDSFQVMGLLAALKSKYRIRIDPSEVGADNFDTAAQMYALIQTAQFQAAQ